MFGLIFVDQTKESGSVDQHISLVFVVLSHKFMSQIGVNALVLRTCRKTETDGTE